MDRQLIICTADEWPDLPSMAVQCTAPACHAPLRMSVQTATLMSQAHVVAEPICVPCARHVAEAQGANIVDLPGQEDALIASGECASPEEVAAVRIYWRLRLLGLIGDE